MKLTLALSKGRIFDEALPRPAQLEAHLATCEACASLARAHRGALRLRSVSPVVAESNIPQKFCGCFTEKLDVAKLETDIDGVKDIGLNPETLRFVTEYIPTIRSCAKDTGLWKGL